MDFRDNLSIVEEQMSLYYDTSQQDRTITNMLKIHQMPTFIQICNKVGKAISFGYTFKFFTMF